MEPAKQQSPQQTQPHAPVQQLPVPPRSGRRNFIILGVVALVVVLGIVGYSVLNGGKENTDDAQVEADVVPVAPRVSGLVAHLAVQDNQHVKKGELILQLDDADFAARVKQAEAELETAQAQAQAADAQAQVAAAGARGGFTSAKALETGSTAAVETARANVTAAEAQAQKAKLELDRDRELLASHVVPQQRLDNAQLDYQSAQATLQQARASLLAAQSRTGEARGKVAQSSPVASAIAAAEAQAKLAHARQKSAEAQLDLARLQLSYTKLVAVEDGMITRLTAREGQLLQPGQPVAALVPDHTYVVANFKETQIGQMKAGDRVEIDVDAFPGRALEGKVSSLAGGTGARFALLPPDNASGNFVKVVQRVPVRIEWVNPPAELPLKPGLSADVTVHVQ